MDIISTLKRYEVKGSKYGLSRTRALLDALGSPDGKLKIIHVAGTNGKGSVCAYLSCILTDAGYRVGTFTSPEVYSYGEKFLINGNPLPSEKLERNLLKAYNAAMTFGDKPTAFEIETAAALFAFAEEGCLYAVVECGLGGLNDSTNAINKKEVCVITSVSLEHTAVLGNTVEEICRQKAGIIKNCPAVVSCLQTEEGLEYFKSKGAYIAGKGLEIKSGGLGGQTFIYGGEEYAIKMLGRAQAYNAATAIECASLIGIDGEYIKTGLERCVLKGRCEIINSGGAAYVLDGSHNIESFSPLIDVLGEINGKKTLVFGCLSDKDVAAAAKRLSPLFSSVFVLTPPSYRAMDGCITGEEFKKYNDCVTVCKDVGDALSRAAGDVIAVCGSFTILKEAEKWIEKKL